MNPASLAFLMPQKQTQCFLPPLTDLDGAPNYVHSVQPRGDPLCSGANHIEPVEELHAASLQSTPGRQLHFIPYML